MVAEVVADFDGAGEPITLPGVPDDLRFDSEVEGAGIESLVAGDGESGQDDGPHQGHEQRQAVPAEEGGEALSGGVDHGSGRPLVGTYNFRTSCAWGQPYTA